jgi:hypothetical protein
MAGMLIFTVRMRKDPTTVPHTTVLTLGYDVAELNRS